MSSLVSDFLINPVLRQARRFSRSTSQADPRDPVTNRQLPTQNNHELAVEDIAERLEDLEGLNNGGESIISGTALTSSPIEENGGLEAELQALEHGRAPATATAVPHRLAPIRSNSGQVDDDMSDNPDYGIPGRFRTNSATSTTFGSGNGTIVDARMSPAEGPSRRSTLDLARSGSLNRPRNSSLPEDDGMSLLRQQIIRIQSMDIAPEAKARMMHQLLTRDYSRAQDQVHARQQANAPSQAGMISQERPSTPGSLSSFIWQMNGALDPSAPEQQYTFHLSPDDLKRTYAPPDPTEADEDGDVAVAEQEQVLGCQHYKRNVKLQCSTCDRWYTCRLCHDEVEDHILIRKDTKNMLCMICGCAQRAGEFCVGCGERAAWYYCGTCKLWDNDANKSIYHCNDCGICRKGRGLGKDFFHCKICGTCISIAVEKSHKCIERVAESDCPICGEYMHTSPSPVVFMPCMHGIHKKCYEEHMKTAYRCPICNKSAVNMETQFRNLDRAIAEQPMPPQFRDTKAMVSCNDCYAKSAVMYHWLGLKCAICDSYNTTQLSILSDPEVEVPSTENQENENTTPPDQNNGQLSSSQYLAPGPGPTRSRRHSSHTHTPPLPELANGRFSPYARPQRIVRSVSPVRAPGFFDTPVLPQNMETDDSGEEDELDFWGREEPRSVTSVENVDEEMEDEDESDQDSIMDECDEDGDDDNEFDLFGHR
ncbi:zf-CHY-domain-containing protein [Mollisia scopiformis]|uniref:Zf-CHY-domain-containing protein n=1 Tax=Mollisia scopiformis TaxID=149040 RepID=A0A194XD37_MOLSC|nr:zf-CHY-domain-containing protein [Mollisia scopiformis]KUJ18090.1 zf-CHY-domain-containing protein [Mollisia scopiformis]